MSLFLAPPPPPPPPPLSSDPQPARARRVLTRNRMRSPAREGYTRPPSRSEPWPNPDPDLSELERAHRLRAQALEARRLTPGDALDPHRVLGLREPGGVVPVAAGAAVLPHVAGAAVDDARGVAHAGGREPRVRAILGGHEGGDRGRVVEAGPHYVVAERDRVVALGERGAQLPAGAVEGAGQRALVGDQLDEAGTGRVAERGRSAGEVGPPVDRQVLGGGLLDGEAHVD